MTAKQPKPTDHWCTPKVITDLLPEFDLDPCSNHGSTVPARRRVMPPEDGLAVPWRGLVWCNPPYSNVTPWVVKAIADSRSAGTMMLVKLDPTTKWWKMAVVDGCASVVLFRKRIRFAGAPCTANFPSALLLIDLPDSVVFLLRREGWVW